MGIKYGRDIKGEVMVQKRAYRYKWAVRGWNGRKGYNGDGGWRRHRGINRDGVMEQ